MTSIWLKTTFGWFKWYHLWSLTGPSWSRWLISWTTIWWGCGRPVWPFWSSWVGLVNHLGPTTISYHKPMCQKPPYATMPLVRDVEHHGERHGEQGSYNRISTIIQTYAAAKKGNKRKYVDEPSEGLKWASCSSISPLITLPQPPLMPLCIMWAVPLTTQQH